LVYDLVVVGGGKGGLATAALAARLGLGKANQALDPTIGSPSLQPQP